MEGLVNKPKSQPSLYLSQMLSLTLKSHWFKPALMRYDVNEKIGFLVCLSVTIGTGDEDPSGVGPSHWRGRVEWNYNTKNF